MEHITEYERSGKASWDVKDKMIMANMWSDPKGRDVLPYNMVLEKHVFVLLAAGNDLQNTQNKEGGIFVYVDVTECSSNG